MLDNRKKKWKNFEGVILKKKSVINNRQKKLID